MLLRQFYQAPQMVVCAALTLAVLLTAGWLLQSQGLDGAQQAAVHVLLWAYGLVLYYGWWGRSRISQLRKLGAQTSGHAPSLALLSGLDMHSHAGDLHGHVQHDLTQAVEQERHRIAQDIHDGVGSQLVGLLASLDPTLPAHRRMILGLESCLLDLKNTVDNFDATDGSDSNIFDALGRLRYRFQPPLDRLNIRMHWKVDVAGPLIAVRAEQLIHVVRIVQESLANVLLHSEAKNVRLSCRYQNETVPCMLLEILDNGTGITKHDYKAHKGKGLSGMNERAKRIGAQLKISTKPGLGTRVRLSLPLVQ